MTQSFDGFDASGKEFMETGAKSFAALSESLDAIVSEAAGFGRTSLETGSAAMEKLAAATSVESALEIQADYARTAYQGFVAHATRVSALYADMAKDAYKPFESIVARTR